MIDLLFKPVADLKLSSRTGALLIRRPDPEEVSRISFEAGRHIDVNEVFFLESVDGRHGYVVAPVALMTRTPISDVPVAQVSMLADKWDGRQRPSTIFNLID